MKTKLLRRLRQEAARHYNFKITSNNFDTWAFVDSNGRTIEYFHSREDAIQFCRDQLRKYVLEKVKSMRG